MTWQIELLSCQSSDLHCTIKPLQCSNDEEGAQRCSRRCQVCIDYYREPNMTALTLTVQTSRVNDHEWQTEQGLALFGNGPGRFAASAHKNQPLAAIRGSAAQELENCRSQDHAKIEERKWQQFFEDPSMWWDNRTNKRNANHPDFKHASSREGLWCDSWFCPTWVPPKLKCLEDSTLGQGKRAQYRKGEGISIYARNTVHRKLPHPNELSLTKLIIDNSKCGKGGEALRFYDKMREEGMKPSIPVSLAALKACSSLTDLQTGKRIHADLIESGNYSNIYVENTLVDMYAKCGSLVDAHRVFDRMLHRDVVSWTAIILGYAQSGEGQLALQLFARMQREGCAPNRVTYLAALKACCSLAAQEEGTQVENKLVKIRCLQEGVAIHTQAVKSGHVLEISVANTLVDMYAKCGSMVDAVQVFERMANHDVVSWNAIILGYARSGEGELALQCFARMQHEGCAPDARTFVAALKACASFAEKEEGTQVEGKLVKVGCLEKGIAIHSQAAHELNIFVANTLVDMYAKCGSMVDARGVFDRIPHHAVVSWNAIILGYARSGEGELALQLFARMQREGCAPDAVTFVAALKACGSLVALETGKRIHTEICSAGLQRDAVVASCLVDFYGKCGCMTDAEQVFNSISTRDIVTWSALIAGYSRQGDTEHVFDLFQRMQKEVLQANDITFLSILTVCSHAGLIDKGKEYFQIMCSDYGVTPSIDHYTCMVDLLGRANQLDDAVAMVKNMPVKPDLVIWMTVLGACRKWMNVTVGRLAFESVLRLDDKHCPAYVWMANIYAGAGMWKESETIQAMRRNARAWKRPGQSWWTDNTGMVHTFVAGDRSHPQIDDILAKLKGVFAKMEEQGYVSELDSDSSDELKESALCGHSEKLALACALINTVPGTTIRIVKKLQVCDDCHKATAIISKVEERAIMCRDASRFHVFKDGKCSCGDIW